MRWNDSFQYHLFTTNRCNLNCVYCALPDKGPQEPRYDAKQLADLLSRSPYTQKIVLFGFMEPTMNMPFVERVIEEARGTPGVDFVMQTNGTRLHLIPKDVMEQFSLLFVSIDGDAYVHNRQRGKTFHGIIDNVIAMKAGFPGKLEAAITVTPAVNLFTSVLGLMNIFDSVTWQLVEDAEPVTDQFMREYRNQFSDLAAYWMRSAQGGVLHDFVPITGFLDFIVNHKEYVYANCGIGRNIAVIAWDGTAYSCPMAMKKVNREEAPREEHVLGDVTRGIVPRAYDLERKCEGKGCSAQDLCRGRCYWYWLDNPSGAAQYCEATRFVIGELRRIAVDVDEALATQLSHTTSTIVHQYTNIMP